MEDKENQEEKSRRSEHPWLNRRNFESVLDERIKAAEAAGMFDNLPGTGKPLALDDDSLVPEEQRIGYRMLKNAGFGPPWLEQRRQIENEQASLERWQAEAATKLARGTARIEDLRDELEQRIQAINRQIRDYNLIVPTVIGQLPLIQLWRELQKLKRA
jgi:hypothetical protein